MKNSMKVAFSGMIAALSAAVMFLTGLVPTATVALPALAGVLLIPVVAELGRRWGAVVYAVCAALSLLLAPDREAALIYILFFGYYPVLMPVLEQLPGRVLPWAAKLLLFNAAAVGEAALTVYVLGIPWENIGFLGAATAPVLLVLANLVFVLYDLALKRLIALYFVRFHAGVQKALRRK